MDLDGDGIELTDFDFSSVFYDVHGDDVMYRMAWVASDDGLLALDTEGDQVIDQAHEISFISYIEGATTDLEGLHHFDSNRDGLLNAADVQWSDFGVWQDRNQNGYTDQGEFNSLTNMDIEVIQLSSDGLQQMMAGNRIYGFGNFTYSNGISQQFADTVLRSANTGISFAEDRNLLLHTPSQGIYWFDTESHGSLINSNDDSIVGWFGFDGDDRIEVNHNYGVIIDGGEGDDHLIGSLGNDVLIGGNGVDVLSGRDGDDILLWEINDNNINGGSGYDTAIYVNNDLNDANDLNINLTEASIENLHARLGNDVIYAGGKQESVTVRSGAGDDIVTGGNNHDVLYGQAGDDTLRGGEGNDFIDGGEGSDRLYGGAGNDTYYWGVGAGNDSINEHQLEAGAGLQDTLIFGQGILSTDIAWRQDGSALVAELVQANRSLQSLRLVDWYRNDAHYIENVLLDNGSVLDITQISLDAGDDYVAGLGTRGLFQTGESIVGNIERSHDVDWLQIHLQAGQRYDIDLEGSWTGGGSLRDPYLRGIYDASGSLIAHTTNDDGGSVLNSHLLFSPENTGEFYIAAGAYSSRTGTYTLSVATNTEVIPEDDFVANASTTGRLSLGNVFAGNLEQAFDIDWARVTLQAGATYNIDLEGSWSNAGSLTDPFLRGIYDAAGDLIANTHDDDGGYALNSNLWFTPETTGDYFVAAGAYTDRVGSYSLSIELSDHSSLADDFTANLSTTGRLSLDDVFSGNIEQAFDVDWARVSLEAAQSYDIDLEGSPTGEGSLGDTYIRGIFDESGTMMANSQNDDAGVGYNSYLRFTPEATGDYFIAAGAYYNRTGTYVMSIDEAVI